MYQPITEKSYLVEVNLGTIAAAKQINFNFIPQLEGSIIYAVEAYSATIAVTTPNGSNTVSTVGLASLAVTFTVGDNQDVYLMPTGDLYPPNVGGFIRQFANKKFNLTKSYVTILGVSGLNNNDAILFNFHYRNAK